MIGPVGGSCEHANKPSYSIYDKNGAHKNTATFKPINNLKHEFIITDINVKRQVL